MNQNFNPQILKQMRSIPLFNSLAEKKFEGLLEDSQTKNLTNGQFLFHQHDPCCAFFVLNSGMMKLFRLTPNGDEKIIDIIRPGHTFAEAVMFMGVKSYPVNAVALQDSQIIAIKTSAYLKILQESTDICIKVMGVLSQRLHKQINEVERLSLHNATFRLVNYLLDFKQNVQENKSEIYLDVSKQIIALQLAITPETLSRILKQLSDNQLITMHNDHIQLTNEKGLINIVKSELA